MQAPPPSADRIVLIVIDTLRADELEAYGGAPEITPHLNRLASEGVVFTNAWAQSPWTLPSLGTLLTGLYPNEHGAYNRGRDLLPLALGVDTLAERLQRAGYTTAAWVNTQFGEAQYQLQQGFDFYSQAAGRNNSQIRDASMTTRLVLDWLEEHGQEKFFLFLHYFDPHLKYEAPSSFRQRFVSEPDYAGPLTAQFGVEDELWAVRSGRLPLTQADQTHLRQLYDAEAAFVDDQIGRLIAYIDAQPWSSSLLVLVTSDHGEEFWDHGGFEHGHTFFNELIRIPLILFSPGTIPAGRALSSPAAQLDVAPTLLEAAGVTPATAASGRSLWDLWEQPGRMPPERPLFSAWPLHAAQAAAYIEGDRKIVFPRSGEPAEFNLGRDPEELTPLRITTPDAERLRQNSRRFTAELERRSLPAQAETPVALNPEQMEDLQSIGYLTR